MTSHAPTSTTNATIVEPRFAAYSANHTYSDMNFLLHVDGGRPWYIPAHRIIVATASAKLKKLVDKMTDTENHIFIDHIKVEDMEEVVEFIYTGAIAVRSENARSIVRVSRNLQLKKLEKEAKACLKDRPVDGAGTDERSNQDKQEELSSDDENQSGSGDDDESDCEVNSTASTAVCQLVEPLESFSLVEPKSIPKYEQRGHFWTKAGVAKVSSIRLLAECAEHFQTLSVAGQEVVLSRNGTSLNLAEPITLTGDKSGEFHLVFDSDVDGVRFSTYHLYHNITILSDSKWPISFFGLIKE